MTSKRFFVIECTVATNAVQSSFGEIDGYPKNDPCTVGYLRLVVAQLNILYGLTDNKEILKFATKFNSYLRVPNVLKMYKEKYSALKKLNRL